MFARNAWWLGCLCLLPGWLGCGTAPEKIAEDKRLTPAAAPASNSPKSADEEQPNAPSGSSDMVTQPSVDRGLAAEDPFGTASEARSTAPPTNAAAAADAPDADREPGSGPAASSAEPPTTPQRTDLGKVVESVGRVFGGNKPAEETPQPEQRGSLWRSLGRALGKGVRNAAAGNEAPNSDQPSLDADRPATEPTPTTDSSPAPTAPTAPASPAPASPAPASPAPASPAPASPAPPASASDPPTAP